jgi:hypothetical protein
MFFRCHNDRRFPASAVSVVDVMPVPTLPQNLVGVHQGRLQVELYKEIKKVWVAA